MRHRISSEDDPTHGMLARVRVWFQGLNHWVPKDYPSSYGLPQDGSCDLIEQ